MANDELDHLLERMPAIADAVERFSSEAVQAQVFQALVDAFEAEGAATGGRGKGGKSRSSGPVDSSDSTKRQSEDEKSKRDQDSSAAKKTATRKSGASKSKQTFTIDKQLDLVKGGSEPFKDFVAKKQPKNAPEKVLTSVYWLSRMMDADEPATLDRVYTCFKHLEWPIPSDLANTTQQAGAKGWLDSSKRDDLKVVTGGENHIEHEMPADVKS